ncbi:UPF0104 family protein [Aerophototrophica crusticola]|uniref:UPF0104 family protein n=1 Tax=Aerophototrophica crusticola TaxID=1709002 RepID=A0A858R6I1_9PROT|nr:UPF0104 family protein [Rhodospirillaceae bacterium B3]
MDSSVHPLPSGQTELEDTPDSGIAGAAGSGSGPSARMKTWTGIATVVFIVALLGVAVHHVMEKVDFAEVWAYLTGLPMQAVLEAVAMTAAGYLVLTLYDVSALRFLKIRVPYSTTALASFAGYAISNNVGWAVISGAGVRYRVYSVAGLRAADVAKVLVFSTTTFTLGVTFTGAIGMLVGPHPVATILSIPDLAVQLIAGASLAFLLALCVIAGVTHKPVKLWRWSFSTPSSKVVISQIVIASVEIVLAAAALWVLMPPDHEVSFGGFLGVFSAALVVSMVSHVPGGLGVFESIMLLGLSVQGASAGAVLGALLAFRAVYYVLPLAVAGLLMLAWEAKAHGKRMLAKRR